MTSTTTTEARRALEAHGVAAHMAERIAHSHTPDLIGQWCDYKSRPEHANMGPGALINAIRYGAPPPDSQGRRSRRDDTLERIRAWIRAHLPDLCDSDGEPHPKAISTVMILEHRDGKGRLSPAEHGPAIRAAVARFQEQIG